MTEGRVVTVATAGRVDVAVRAAFPELSRRLVHVLLADGAIRVNGRRVAKGHHLLAGDRLEVRGPTTLAGDGDGPAALAILRETADWVAVDKPGGMPSHALDPRERGTAAGILLGRYPEIRFLGDPLGPGLVHRLDTGTSGILLAARSAAAYDQLREAFRARRAYKRYVAIVHGTPTAGRDIEIPLAHDRERHGRMVPATAGDRAWPATTRVVDATALPGGRSRVAVVIPTGVTHQIRAHLAWIGHPVVGDDRYGAPPSPALPAGRHALHAERLEIPEATIALSAPLPPDLMALLA